MAKVICSQTLFREVYVADAGPPSNRYTFDYLDGLQLNEINNSDGPRSWQIRTHSFADIGAPCGSGTVTVVMTTENYNVLVNSAGVVGEIQKMSDGFLAVMLIAFFFVAFWIGYRFANRVGNV